MRVHTFRCNSDEDCKMQSISLRNAARRDHNAILPPRAALPLGAQLFEQFRRYISTDCALAMPELDSDAYVNISRQCNSRDNLPAGVIQKRWRHTILLTASARQTMTMTTTTTGCTRASLMNLIRTS